VETGTSQSVISKRRYHELREQEREKEMGESTNGDNDGEGAKQKAEGEFTAMIWFTGERLELNFLNQDTGGMLLGMDFKQKRRQESSAAT